MEENFALSLARRQKRLKYWGERFSSETMPTNRADEFEKKFMSYKSLLAKAAFATDNAEREQVSTELDSIDREMTSLFEARRLMTSDVGVAAVKDYSQRGGAEIIADNDSH